MNRKLAGPNANDETAWLAVRYLLGELPPDEVATFEARLGEDQTARDALVQATRLVATIAAAGPAKTSDETTIARRGRGWRRIGAVAATAAALLVGALVIQQRQNRQSNDRSSVTVGEIDPARLVALWSESSEMLAGTFEAAAADEVSLVDSDHESNGVFLPPDWMLAAVEQEAWPLPADLDGEDDAVERN